MQKIESELELKRWYQKYRREVLELDLFEKPVKTRKYKKKKSNDKNRNKN